MAIHRKEHTLSGHIYCRELRGSNQQRWYAVIDIAPPGQPRKQLTRAFTTRREARAWAAQMAAHRHTRTGSPLVAEYLQSWLCRSGCDPTVHRRQLPGAHRQVPDPAPRR
jgi:hypothetical protein